MKAAFYLGGGKFRFQDAPEPKAGEDQVFIRLRVASICGSDASRLDAGIRPELLRAIQGHEFGGEILEAKAGFSAGERVAAYPVITCGKCDPCQRGIDHLCMNLEFLGIQNDGGFAEKAAVPASNLFRIPPRLKLKYASLVEPLAVSLHATRRVRLSGGETAVVIGCGLIGYFCAVMLRAAGAGQVLVIDINDRRLEAAQQTGFGTLNPQIDDLPGEIMRKNGGRLADVVFDCAGKPEVPNLLGVVSRVEGKIVIVGTYETVPLFDLQKIYRKELQVIGSRIYTRQEFGEAVQMLASWPDLEHLPLLFMPLEEINQAFDILHGQPEALRIVLTP